MGAQSINVITVLKPKTKEKNCKVDQVCPVGRKCLDSSIIYRATVNEEDGRVNIYTVLTCNEFRTRWRPRSIPSIT